MPISNTSGWQYAAWAEQSTVAARLAMLNQHITEVSMAAVDSQTGDGSRRRLGDGYMQLLMDERNRLQELVGIASADAANQTPVRIDPLI